jgi:phosphoribosylamine--glycine ligase
MAWKLAQSPLVTEIICAPGNPGMAAIGECVPVPVTDLDGLVALARDRAVDLVAVGPEDPLVAGLGDRLTAAGIPVLGHSAAAARIEGSKAWAKGFMARHGIPTARSLVVHDRETAGVAIDELANGGPVVLKVDALMAGKGVIVAPDAAAAHEAVEGRFGGAAGETLVVEECLTGPEVSILLVVDGTDYRLLAPSCDHKRAFDWDEGPNTGGMGVYTPTARVDAAMLARIEEEILRPTVEGMVAEGIPLHGVLYPGLMLTADGPKVIEFNARFGDPETQVVLPTTVGDLGEWAFAVANGTLRDTPQPEQVGAAVGVALASGGYPGSYATGFPISGLAAAAADPEVLIFHAGTKRNATGDVVTGGGRVLTVVGLGSNLAEARERAYGAAAKIEFEGKMMRTDIAAGEVDGMG